MVTKLLLGTAIAVAAIGTATPASADASNPYSTLCMVGQCPAPAPTTARHVDASQIRAGIQEGMQFPLSAQH
jgi:hypothetical protein